jgi:nucleoid DNA-binding protein
MSCHKETKEAIDRLFEEGKLTEDEILKVIEQLFVQEIEMARKTGQRIDSLLYEMLDTIAEDLKKSAYPIEKILHNIFSVIVNALETSAHEEIKRHHRNLQKARTQLENSIEREKSHYQELLDVIETFSKELGLNHNDPALQESCKKIETLLEKVDRYYLSEQ